MGVRLSSRKKSKSVGSDGADDDVAEQMEETVSASIEGENSLAEPASVSAENEQMSLAPAISKEGEVKESTAWIEDDFIPLSTEDPLRSLNAEQEREDREPLKDAVLPESRSGNGLDQDTVNLAITNDSKIEASRDYEIRDDSRDSNNIVDEKPFMPASTPNVHKRFGSEEPMLAEEEVAIPGVQNDGQDAENANEDHEDAFSDDDAPEVVGSKSISKHIKPAVKMPKRTKRKGKSNTGIKERSAIVDSERVLAEEDHFFVDPLPKEIQSAGLDSSVGVYEPLNVRTKISDSSQTPKKRKLFDEGEKRPKDILRDGVTYRTVSEELPTSKRHRASHLPPKSNVSNWRLKKQILGRKRVQQVWGGRSAFLRT